MATKVANFGGPNPHTSGLFADMTVDGPEIGTLVLVVDRAKNLPNRKTMGKQTPYCAGRLGKEAQKTETDRRGGQTPRWDQELRFTVHDSPDYHNLKISIFSEDKRTDLIGEAWVSLKEILVPGGGKRDLWQGLNFKGKYAGELRLELTYYDNRPKPETSQENLVGVEDLARSGGSGSGRVKRRPLPSNPRSGHVTPDTIPNPTLPGRAKHGPRDYRTPPRATSMPPETAVYAQPQPGYGAPPIAHPHLHGSLPTAPLQQAPPNQYYGEYDSHQDVGPYDDDPYSQPQLPDFLPQLPPSNRQRGSFQPQPRFSSVQGQAAPQPRPQIHTGLPHSHSSPAVPLSTYEPSNHEEEHQLRIEYPEPIPDVNYQYQQLGSRPRRSDLDLGFQSQYNDSYAFTEPFDGGETEAPPPPPPPMHSHSAPIVPHYSPDHTHLLSTPQSTYSGTPPNARQHSVPNSSPLQSIERVYGTPRRTPVHARSTRGTSIDGYAPSSEQYMYETPSPNHPPAQTPSPYSRSQLASRPLPHRHSIADPYQTTPPRPHPLSQEVPRPHSPQPYHAQGLPPSSSQPNDPLPYQHDYRDRDAVPLIKPRAVSPRPRPPPQTNSAPQPHSSYSIQHPVSAFESCDNSPLSTSRPVAKVVQASAGSTPARKSISSQVSTPNSAGPGMPFSPDSFSVHNPNARQSTLPHGASPHSPYQIRPGSETMPRDGDNGPIVGWHGQEVDPSDHLPVDSWAPEPEKKVPMKTYGLGRDRDFGPRNVQGGADGRGRNLSRDTVVNVRMKSQPQPEQDATPSRNRLQKRTGQERNSMVEPLKERHNYNSISVPDPYAQQQYSQSFYQPNDRGHTGFGPISASPTDTLSQEISSIDIGSGRHSQTGSMPSTTAYVPVRSHKDRRTFY